MLSRREFMFGVPAAAALYYAPDLSALLNEEDEKWISAQKDARLQQKTLDDALKSDKDASQYIKRFYNVEVVELNEEEQKKSRDKFALIWDKYQLKFSDAAAEKDFKELLKQQAKEYVKAKERKQKNAEDDAYRDLVTVAVDKVRNAKDAAVWLDPAIWGRNLQAIGFVTNAFWAEKSYKTDGDRRSTLFDHLMQRAKDMHDDVKLNDLWKGTLNKNSARLLYTHGILGDMIDIFSGIFISRGYVSQYDGVANKKRELSPERLKKIATEWENEPSFKTIIKNEQGRRTDDPGSDEAKDQMDEMGFKYIPWQGKIIPYDSKKVMEYKFEKK